MLKHKKWIVPLALVTLSSAALADPDKDESGKGHHGHKGGEYKEKYWDGHCKVERKYDKHGGYKEKRKCKDSDRHVDRDYRYREPIVERRTYYQPQENVEYREPRVDVDVRIRQ